MTQKAILSWSGGKDSAFALHAVQTSKEFEIVALLTTVTGEYERISMHGVRQVLLEQQAASLGLPLEPVVISTKCSNEEWESKVAEVLTRHQRAGANHVIIGDIFLEDLRAYREKNLAKIGMKGAFPLWKRDTRELSREFIDTGFRTIITCVDTEQLDGSFAGRVYDREFLSDLPDGVDPCGENGEFHSFVYDGPPFAAPVSFTKGETVLRENRFRFCDLVPDGSVGE